MMWPCSLFVGFVPGLSCEKSSLEEKSENRTIASFNLTLSCPLLVLLDLPWSSPLVLLFIGHHLYSISIAAQALITLLWQTWRRMQAKAAGLHNASLDGFGWPWISVSKCEMLLGDKTTQLLDVNGSQILRCFRLFLDQHVIHWLAGWKKVQPAPSFFFGGEVELSVSVLIPCFGLNNRSHVLLKLWAVERA